MMIPYQKDILNFISQKIQVPVKVISNYCLYQVVDLVSERELKCKMSRVSLEIL